ncbi:MAG: methionyl-tRNA formyltransferase [Thermoanaerobaculia bacterium]|nr:methionyl-tRNA formyltransferase [Thermoanaerobaculia bacterium]
MEGLRLAFFGTPDFAVPTLEALCAAGSAPRLVVSQPDRPAGRGRALRRPPVVESALAAGLDVVQPNRVRDEDFVARLTALELDVAVVVAFGQIFPRTLLDVPRFGCVNVHASLLPRHRGAAPIQAALRSRDEVAGVCTMQMEEGLDSGPVLGRAETRLYGVETAGELSARLSHLGASLLLETLAKIAARGSVEGIPQDHELATYAPRLTKGDGVIDWTQPAEGVDAQLRAMTPWPGGTTSLDGSALKVLAGRLSTRESEGAADSAAVPGTLVEITDRALRVACGSGVFELLEVQRPGRRAVSARDLANGERLESGTILGS